MSSEELDEYWKNWADAFIPENTLDDVYLLNSHIRISVIKMDKTIIRVYGHNSIELGIFMPDNGCVWEIMEFMHIIQY